MIILTSDWHLDDIAANEYRWEAFETLLRFVIQYEPEAVFHLGDLTDRKDRFSGVFVNRLFKSLKSISARAPLYILRGNHDTPLNGPPFWEFLSDVGDRIQYITQPTVPYKPLILLPFAANPVGEWQGLDFNAFEAAFLHATVVGALMENGTEAHVGARLPIFPRDLKLYSGDVHTPQTLRNLTYVGAPHPVKYGDTYLCRMLVLNKQFDIDVELPLSVMRKHVIEISSVEELQNYKVREGDQAHVRINMTGDAIVNYGAIEKEIYTWAEQNNVNITNLNQIVDVHRSEFTQGLDSDPKAILEEYVAKNKISQELLEDGAEFLKEAQG